MDSASSFWFEDGFSENVRSFILANTFRNPTLYCQNESERWARRLKQHYGSVILHDGFYYDGGDLGHPVGHTWLEVEGYFFDPTAAQFDDYPKINREAYDSLEEDY